MIDEPNIKNETYIYIDLLNELNQSIVSFNKIVTKYKESIFYLIITIKYEHLQYFNTNLS
jgi:hypothetical protein